MEEKSSKLMEIMSQNTKEPKVEREFLLEQTCENRTIVFYLARDEMSKSNEMRKVMRMCLEKSK